MQNESFGTYEYLLLLSSLCKSLWLLYVTSASRTEKGLCIFRTQLSDGVQYDFSINSDYFSKRYRRATEE
jgi:hypothetical protein